MSTSDSLLWNQLKEGNKAALEKIYRSEVDYLYNYCRRISTDLDLIEDAVQELFIELWDRRARLGTTTHIRPYLLTSIRRKVIYLLKKKGKITNQVDEALAFQTDEAVDAEIIQSEVQKEQSDHISAALETLSKRQREAIYLKFFNESSYEEICDIMEVNYQSARNLVSSGLKKMKGLLGDQLFFWIVLSTILGSITYI
jgi:RNA polymerase sigma factor (sigma-70 family)